MLTMRKVRKWTLGLCVLTMAAAEAFGARATRLRELADLIVERKA
jgi:hypothetical protein